jgi:hypothetical protein
MRVLLAKISAKSLPSWECLVEKSYKRVDSGQSEISEETNRCIRTHGISWIRTK